MHLRVFSPAEHSRHVLAVFQNEPLVSALAINRSGSMKPAGDVIEADVPREIASTVIEQLVATGVTQRGTIHIDPVSSWVSRRGFNAEKGAPGAGADSVVWPNVIMQAYDSSELNVVYLGLITLATMLAGIAIVLDSQILTIGAMVLGPDFGPVVALGVALVTRRADLARLALRALLVGFLVAISVTAVFAWLAAQAGWITPASLNGTLTAFIYSPNRWSFVVALIAAVAGVLSLTSSQTSGISGVFISVTTIPAAANIAVAGALGAWHEVWGSALQLLINVVTMMLAGWLTLVVLRAGQRWLLARRRRAA